MTASITPSPYAKWTDLPANYGRNLSAFPLARPSGPSLSLNYREYNQSRPVCSSYQTWWSKYHVENPSYIAADMKGKYGPQKHTQWPFETESESGKYHTDPSFRVQYTKPNPLDSYHRGLKPVAEAKRSRAEYSLYGENNIYANPYLYPYSNVMTGSGYRRPVYSVYGPMLKNQYHGINWQHNRHGNMNFDDHY